MLLKYNANQLQIRIHKLMDALMLISTQTTKKQISYTLKYNDLYLLHN